MLILSSSPFSRASIRHCVFFDACLSSFGHAEQGEVIIECRIFGSNIDTPLTVTLKIIAINYPNFFTSYSHLTSTSYASVVWKVFFFRILVSKAFGRNFEYALIRLGLITTRPEMDLRRGIAVNACRIISAF
jgi:hypothetical protein